MLDGRDDGIGVAAFDPKESAGLFVGISAFEDPRILGIPYAVDDAVDLAYQFTLDLGLISPERAVLLLAGEPCKPESGERLARLIEKGVRRANARQFEIYRQLEHLTQGTGDRGLFVLSVATHGVSDRSGDLLVAADSFRGRTFRSGVAVTELLDEVARADASSGEMGRRLVLLDACRERFTEGTRGDADSAMAKSFADAIARAKGVAILSGSTLGGYAYDDPERKNGVFTAAILDGLAGEAPAGPDGWITVRSLADFVRPRVVKWIRRWRPDHASRTLGIGLHVEATADEIPLAHHPVAREMLQRYRARRESALNIARENLGNILTGQNWDQIKALLPFDRCPGPETERLLEEIEALDGKERSQRSLRDFLRDMPASSNSPRPVEIIQKRPATSIFKPEVAVDPTAGSAMEGPLGMRMRFVPSGIYSIGSLESGPDEHDESLHKVQFSRGFWLGETPVTQGQWKQLVPGPKQPSHFRSDGDDLPVESINWFEAVEFANRLSDKEGLPRCYQLVNARGTLGGGDFTCDAVVSLGLECSGYRLPTESEWEVAARAGVDPSDGKTLNLHSSAWFSENAGKRTHPVGKKAPNDWGFCDLLGNVFEWTGDWYGAYPKSRTVDPLGPIEGAVRVMRGGSWISDAGNCREACRYFYVPSHRDDDLGFRLARSQSALQPRGAEPQALRSRRRGEPE